MGIIPACAGNTGGKLSKDQISGDHPRMCGEHHQPVKLQNIELGSSPHVRGTLVGEQVGQQLGGIIPACAENTIGADHVFLWLGDHPRMCGEHDTGKCTVLENEGSSPHVRGTHVT